MSVTTKMETGVFRGPRTLSVMPTYTCPAACSNCASGSSPRVRTSLALESILEGIRQAKDLRFYNVVFTGGEATLHWSDLLKAIAYAASLGLPTRLVTNAHWAHSEATAADRLQALIQAGLNEINYSTGDEHARFIPVERVLIAAVVAARLRLPVWVMVELRGTRRVTAAILSEHPLVRGLSKEERCRIEFSESPWMPLDPTVVETYPAGVACDNLGLKAHIPCPSVLQTYTMQADGRVGACCGIGMRTIPELSVAEVQDPDFLRHAIDEAENDLLKLWIHYKGPEQVLAWASAIDTSIEWEGMYAHRCQACARIYKDPAVGTVIREHYEEIIADVLQTAWFDEEYLPGITATARA